MRFRWYCTLVFGSGIMMMAGCGDGSGGLPQEPDLVPVTGKVTVEGQPLAEAVVTFLQVDEKGTLAIGETDEDGTYILTHLGRPGAAAAEYSVTVSYLVGPDGTIYGQAPRSGLAKPYGMFAAKELVVPEWSDFGKATTRVTVSEAGGVFDFDLPALLPPPEPSEEESSDDDASAENTSAEDASATAEETTNAVSEDGGEQPE
ncbi:carboxypeptidase-like regulatory domain-containing protein [Tautonia marina]|uniref:carboxypeptidase-like regulatory domain-containing protein n=1 Tax=Tautonia marina TaxID=2653855 RepID=UPI001261222E|nr:carboxypeptidase-like regulatory domain-containing protein [Tautonia marina]